MSSSSVDESKTPIAADGLTSTSSASSSSSGSKRKTDDESATPAKKAKLDANPPADPSIASSTPASATAASTTLAPHKPFSVLTEMPTDEDELFSHYVDQHVSKRVIQEGTRSCILETAYPPFYTAPPTPPTAATSTAPPSRPPAKQYPFSLDPFQSQAIASLERHESVLVSAHTSAGKTVVAEYAIALALRDKQRVIYTSPIKALSNQKYRELSVEFGDVGLMTGDITISPTASCLVMTTEILRNMLYRGSEVVREVSTVIYDEIHYMRNKERGVVWEETIIMLPHTCTFVFLSATIPNASEFACWIAKLHSQPVNVVYTDYRPTPLQHYLFPTGSDGLHLVVDEKGVFRDDNFQKALALLRDDSAAAAGAGGDGGGEGGDAGGGMVMKKRKKKQLKKGEVSDIYKIVKMCLERNLQPVIIFSFSKRECEQHAQHMSKLDFTDADERQLIDTIFHNAISSLTLDDQRLPQVTSMLPILKRGIGIHHSGLLPILKEIVEILFQEGLLRCLFSTETFSMGLNMPAKTVVFTSVRKWDGAEFRVVTSGEYIQMSGRAGRRGLDERGVVICMLDEALDPATAKAMLKGESDVLNSSFHLGYNMLLNLLRVEDVNPVKLMSRSFHQFQSTRKAPALTLSIEAKEQEREKLKAEMAAAFDGGADGKAVDVAEYVLLQEQVVAARDALRGLWCQPVYVLPFLNAGRLVRVRATVKDGREWGWGAIVSYTRRERKKLLGKRRDDDDNDPTAYTIDVLLRASATSIAPSPHRSTPSPQPATTADGGEYLILPTPLTAIDALSSIRIFLPKELKERAARKQVGASIRQVKEKMGEGSIPTLGVVDDMKVKEVDQATALQAQLDTASQRLANHPLSSAAASGQRERLLSLYSQQRTLDAELVKLKDDRRLSCEDVVMAQQLLYMQAVLRRVGCTSASNVIDVKGRVAAEVSTCDELVASELMLQGAFLDMPVDVMVAVCSSLVMNDRYDEDELKKLSPQLRTHFQLIQTTARRIAEIQRDARLPIDPDEYVSRFSPVLMEVVLEWCRGAKFSALMRLTSVFEGSVIRCMRRLEELLRQLGVASKSIGNVELEAKFMKGIELLKRDIVFAASLYL